MSGPLHYKCQYNTMNVKILIRSHYRQELNLEGPRYDGHTNSIETVALVSVRLFKALTKLKCNVYEL